MNLLNLAASLRQLYNDADTLITGHQYDSVNKEIYIYGNKEDGAAYMLVFNSNLNPIAEYAQAILLSTSVP